MTQSPPTLLRRGLIWLIWLIGSFVPHDRFDSDQVRRRVGQRPISQLVGAGKTLGTRRGQTVGNVRRLTGGWV
jgi:hypothetical protein